MTIFADRLREARQRVRTTSGQRMTQGDLAQAVGVERNTVSRWENSGVRPKDPAVIGKLADVLDVTMEWLVGMVDAEGERPQRSGEPAAPWYSGQQPVVERRLPVPAYELIDGYLARLEAAGCSVAQTREAERLLRESAYNRLRVSDARTRALSEMLDDIALAWDFVTAVLGREGITP